MGKTLTFKRSKQSLLLCRDHKLNESLRRLWGQSGYDVHVVNTVSDAHVWWDENIKKMGEGFQVCMVTLNGRGREYWQLFLGTIDPEFLPPVEVDL